MGLGVWGFGGLGVLGFGFRGLEFRGLGSRVWWFSVYAAGLGVQCLGFRVWGLFGV